MPKRALEAASWLVAAAVSAYAARLAVQFATPIDVALPMIAAVLTLIGAPVAVPLLIGAEMVVADETVRLLTLGVIIAAGFVWSAATSVAAFKSGGWSHRTPNAPRLAVGALLLLRWIPFPTYVLRELVLLGLAAAMVWLLRNTPFAILFAVAVVLITPAVPLRTLALPLAMTGAVFLARFFQMPRIALTVPSLFVLACMLTFFAWSGVVARGFPYFAHSSRESPRREVLNLALAPSRSALLEVPADATALIVSGANVARFRRGTLLGRIEPGAIPIVIGDGSDWGYMRREFFYGGHNPFPARPAGRLRDYGYGAWVDGAGLVALPPRARTIRVTADANLPRDGSLQVEGFALR